MVVICVMATILVSSCSITKNIPPQKYLLDKTTIKIDDSKQKTISSSELDNYIRQKPNKRILLFRFHLRMYNAANPSKYTGIHRWLKTIGEEPVILDTFQTGQTTQNLKQFLENKGYYSSTVKDSTIYRKRQRAETEYNITLGKPYKINEIRYIIEDTTVRSYVLSNIDNSLIKKGVRFDKDILNDERKRIEEGLKEQGYFYFSRDFITFTADTALEGTRVNLDMNIRNRFIRNQFGDRIVQEYKKFQVSKVYIYPNYDPITFFNLKESNQLDTILFHGNYYIYSGNPGIDLKVLHRASLIEPGQLYSESMVTKTRNNLSSLRLFRMVNIFFEPEGNGDGEVEASNDPFLFFNEQSMEQKPKFGKLNCHIQLAAHTLQSYQVDLVGTTSSSDFGAEANFNYQHKNLFKGAEIFDLKLRGMFELIQQAQMGTYDPAFEVGSMVGFSFPRFLSPFSGKEYITKYAPSTKLSASYNYQNRPDYTRTIAGLNFGYSWKNERNVTHSITPVEINIINIFEMDTTFQNKIENNAYLLNSYQNQFITLTGYNFIFNNQKEKKNINYTLFRFNFEISGNILNGIYSTFSEKNPGEAYQIFGTDFSQFVRTELNYTFHNVIDKNNTFVYRVYSGIGYPYGNSKALPFEKKFFSGGASGVRAWHARSLGPGTFSDTSVVYPNQTGDIKFEANVEYRFKLFWMLEGALFVDAGNIWAINQADERPGALFKFNSFYKQLALGTGLGVRMNLGFFTVRLDMGVKVHDPAVNLKINDSNEATNWIPFQRPYVRDDFAFQFGIGYPF
ncbi:MAG TPA: BamA/TamA family outer membrane protein [Tenuifilaceae bacterium]|nr:BamA/TamA family outer membrane protein [Tenuifilaceae bacterium]HPJ46404.1 BamA/TamA family outer membrane protein [Tenuifilaceae bacterium]HPQ35058.1 BamA/TamA family outer membrane protein [Tenuifilaceae bacterium]